MNNYEINKVKIFGTYILFALVLFFGCSSRNYLIMKEYKNQKINSKLFVVAPFSINIGNKKQFAKDVGVGDEENRFKDMFREIFPQPIKKQWRIDSVLISDNKIALELENRDLLIDETDTIKMMLPKSNETIFSDSIKADYILFLDNFSTYDAEAVPATMFWTKNGVPVFVGGRQSGVLLASNYVIWDNLKGNVVAYGHSEMRRSYSLYTKSRSTWEDCIYNFTVHILKMSPFATRF